MSEPAEGEVLPFRHKPLDPEHGVLRGDGTLLTECDEHVHVYASVPGRCQCGKNFWEPDGHPDKGYTVTVPSVVVEVEEKLTREVREETGDETLSVVFDMTPLLRPEKPKRKWPDDFRGFLSNVRPRKQK